MLENNEVTVSDVACCSFCGKLEEQTARLVKGPGGVCICWECVGVCREMVEKGVADFEQIREALVARGRER